MSAHYNKQGETFDVLTAQKPLAKKQGAVQQAAEPPLGLPAHLVPCSGAGGLEKSTPPHRTSTLAHPGLFQALTGTLPCGKQGPGTARQATADANAGESSTLIGASSQPPRAAPTGWVHRTTLPPLPLVCEASEAARKRHDAICVCFYQRRPTGTTHLPVL